MKRILHQLRLLIDPDLKSPLNRFRANLDFSTNAFLGCLVSSDETRRIAELLSNEDDALRLLRGAVHQAFWSSQPAPSCIFPLRKLAGEISEIEDGPEPYEEPELYTPFETMFRRLYEYAESPIERTLFGALSIRLRFGSRRYHVFVHKPASDLEKYIDGLMTYADDFTSAFACDAFVRGGEYPDEDGIWLGDAFRWGDPILNDIVWEANSEYVDFVNAVHLVPQPTLKLSGKTIRPDLAIWFPADDGVRLLVECDGYEFHSSRDKFKSDRARDRELLELGYRVLRYSGSEIKDDPIRLAKSVVDYLCTLSIPVRPNLYRRMASKLNLLHSHSAGLVGLPEDFREIAELSRAIPEIADGVFGSGEVVEIGSAKRNLPHGKVQPRLVLALERLEDDRLRELLGAVLFGRDFDPAHAPAPARFLECIRQARRHPRDFCILNLTRRPLAQFLDRAAHYLCQSRSATIG